MRAQISVTYFSILWDSASFFTAISEEVIFGDCLYEMSEINKLFQDTATLYQV